MKNWAILFNILSDKYGYTGEDLERIWHQVNLISKAIASEEILYSKISITLKQFHIVLDVPAKKDNTVKYYQTLFRRLSWGIILYAMLKFGFPKEEMPILWERIQYLEESINQGCCSVEDLRQAVGEDTDFVLNDNSVA